MKRTVAIVLALTLTAALAACGTKNDTPAQEQEPVQQEQNTEPEVQQETAIDYTGGYADRISQRATMSIVAHDDDTLGFGISWSNSAFETNEWTMSGKLSEDGTRVDYTDGKMVTTSFGEPGTEPGEETTPVDVLVIYENGTGHFDIADGVFTWVSDNDDFAENPVFERIPE